MHHHSSSKGKLDIVWRMHALTVSVWLWTGTSWNRARRGRACRLQPQGPYAEGRLLRSTPVAVHSARQTRIYNRQCTNWLILQYEGELRLTGVMRTFAGLRNSDIRMSSSFNRSRSDWQDSSSAFRCSSRSANVIDEKASPSNCSTQLMTLSQMRRAARILIDGGEFSGRHFLIFWRASFLFSKSLSHVFCLTLSLHLSPDSQSTIVNRFLDDGLSLHIIFCGRMSQWKNPTRNAAIATKYTSS